MHCRISSITSLHISRLTALQKLCLRQNQISKIEGLEPIAGTLKDLDLYDNLIAHMGGLASLTKLESLDLSYNAIKHIKNIDQLVKLRNLYFASNRISKIEGVERLVDMRNLELGANRIRVGGLMMGDDGWMADAVRDRKLRTWIRCTIWRSYG